MTTTEIEETSPAESRQTLRQRAYRPLGSVRVAMQNTAIIIGMVSVGWFSWIMIKISISYNRINEALQSGTPVSRNDFTVFPFGIGITAVLGSLGAFGVLLVVVTLLHAFWAQPQPSQHTPANTVDEPAAAIDPPGTVGPDSASARDAALLDLYSRYREQAESKQQGAGGGDAGIPANQTTLQRAAELLRNPHVLPAGLPDEYQGPWERESAELFTVFAQHRDPGPADDQ